VSGIRGIGIRVDASVSFFENFCSSGNVRHQIWKKSAFKLQPYEHCPQLAEKIAA
jgi:hypothetical protein